MSEAKRYLQRGQRELKRLYGDLYPPAWSRRDWDTLVPARETLGNDAEIELWYLAEHFLLAWSDWTGLKTRYARYYGQPETELKKTWNQLDAKCRGLASLLLRDPSLDGILAHAWRHSYINEALADTPQYTPRAYFHAVIRSHRVMTLAGTRKTSQETRRLSPNQRARSRKVRLGQSLLAWPVSGTTRSPIYGKSQQRRSRICGTTSMPLCPSLGS